MAGQDAAHLAKMDPEFEEVSLKLQIVDQSIGRKRDL